MTTTQPMLVLVGAGGHSSDVLAVIEANQLLESDDVPGCIHVVDEGSPSSRRFEGRAVEFVPNFAFDATKPCAFIAAIGYPAPRRSVVERAQAHGYAPARPLLHPTAEVAFGARVGDGSVVFAHTWLSPWVSIGAHSFASYGTTIGHDSDIGDFVSIMPSATISGSVTIEDGALIGAGAVVLEGVTIGSNASVGAGAVVIGDVPPDVVVVGVPAQPTTQTSVVEDQP